MNDDIIKKLVDRFLSWPVPKSVNSDLCMSDPTYPCRYGTSIMTAVEARQMIEYLLCGFPYKSIAKLQATEEFIRTFDKWHEEYKGPDKIMAYRDMINARAELNKYVD